MKRITRLSTLCFFVLSQVALSPVFAADTCPESTDSPLEIADEATPGGSDSDLVVSRTLAGARVYTEWQRFSRSSCAYREGCVAAPGRRRLLRFYTRIINQGTQNFHLGRPTDPANADHVRYDSCHGHYHVKDWAEYELLSASGTTVIRGRKQAFCLQDTRRIYGNAARRYRCGYQGITAGWADDYSDTLPCQWIDITGVPPGSYLLQLTVNPARRFIESNYDNNRVRVPVTLR